MNTPTTAQLRKLTGIANYQFGKEIGSVLFDRQLKIACSRRTGRIRHVYREGKMVATLRPRDGYLALTPDGARRILAGVKDPPNVVVVQGDVGEFVKNGGDVFAKHVLRVSENLRPGEEAIVTDETGALMAVGRAVLSANDMKHFKRGVAVKVRKAVGQSTRSGNALLTAKARDVED